MSVPSGVAAQYEHREAAERAGELARRLSWVIARRQLLAIGFSPGRIRGWLRNGRLYPTRYAGVYAWGRSELTEPGEHAAALLFAGEGSALDGLSALWWRGLLERRPSQIQVATPSQTASRAGLQIRRPVAIERTMHRDLPVVALARALLVAAADLSHDSLRLVLARAEFKKLLSLAELEAALGSGKVGSRAVRAAIDARLPQLARCVNGFERDFVLLCERAGLPIPEPNVRIGRYVPDMLWEEANLIVELDGKAAHTTPAQKRADATKQRWLERRGHEVLRFGWRQVEFEPDLVAARLRPRLREMLAFRNNSAVDG